MSGLARSAYEVLGVARTAEPGVIRRAYRKVAALVHPDAGGSTEAMVELNTARDILLDAELRREHDKRFRPPVIPGRVRTINVRMPLVMPWGKHQGTPLTDVPGDYLRWVLQKADYADAGLKAEVRKELDRRKSEPGAMRYVTRGGVVHLVFGDELPECGSLYSRKPRDRYTRYFPDGARACRRGCFE